MYGTDSPKHLDRKWAITLYDFNNKLALFVTNMFASKQIWRNGLECASYQSWVGAPDQWKI